MSTSALPLQIEDLHAYYGKRHILQGATLSVPAAQVSGLLGRNGVGKTTLLNAVMGLLPRTRGEVRVFGRPMVGKSPVDVARLGVAYMPQGYRLFPALTVAENVAIGRTLSRAPVGLPQVLEILPELAPLLSKRADTLSGGQQQLAALARCLSTGCRLLLIDEPTEGLMPALVERIGKLCRSIAAQGVSILLIEQNARLALDTCDFIYVMEKGTITAQGTPAELRSGDELERYLGIAGVEA